jgi:hypothetical protein
MRNFILIALFAGVAGCAGTTGSARVDYAYSSPDLVYIDDGVQVVADYDYPVFYTDNAYWMYRGGFWYRSPYYNRGWVTVYNDVPYRLRHIDRPYAYAHFHGNRTYARGYNTPVRTYDRPVRTYDRSYDRGYNRGTYVRPAPSRAQGGVVVRPSGNSSRPYEARPAPRRRVDVRDHRH